MIPWLTLLTSRTTWIVFGIGLVLAAGAGTVQYHHTRVAQSYRDGQIQARDSIKKESAQQLSIMEERLRVARGRVDTLWRKSKATSAKVDTFLKAIHDTVWIELPAPAQQALSACRDLQQDCAALRLAYASERATSDSVRTFARIQQISDKDSIRTLIKRPTRTQQFWTGIGSALLGAALYEVFGRQR